MEALRGDKMGVLSDYKNYLRANTDLMPFTMIIYVRTIQLFMVLYKNDFSIENINQFITEHTREKHSYYMKSPFMHLLNMLGRGSEFAQVKKIKPKPKIRTMQNIPTDIVASVIEKIEHPVFKLIAEIQFMTGARASDVLRIKMGYLTGDIKDGFKLRIIGKGNKERWVDVTPRIAEKLKKLEKRAKDEDIFLISNSRDKTRALKTCYHYYWKALKRAVQKMDVNFSTHYFRHKFVQDALDEGFNILSIKEALGHSSIDTTMRYMIENKATKEIAKKIRWAYED